MYNINKLRNSTNKHWATLSESARLRVDHTRQIGTEAHKLLARYLSFSSLPQGVGHITPADLRRRTFPIRVMSVIIAWVNSLDSMWQVEAALGRVALDAIKSNALHQPGLVSVTACLSLSPSLFAVLKKDRHTYRPSASCNTSTVAWQTTCCISLSGLQLNPRPFPYCSPLLITLDR